MSVRNQLAAYVCAPHYRVLVYDEQLSHIKSIAAALWRNPEHSLHRAFGRFKEGPTQWLLSMLLQSLRATFLAALVVVTVAASIAFFKFANQSDGYYYLVFIVWGFFPFVSLSMFIFADELSLLIHRISFMKTAIKELPAVPEPPPVATPRPSPIASGSVLPSRAASDNAYTRYCRDPRQFVVSTLLFGVQILWVTACFAFVLGIAAAVIEGGF